MMRPQQRRARAQGAAAALARQLHGEAVRNPYCPPCSSHRCWQWGYDDAVRHFA